MERTQVNLYSLTWQFPMSVRLNTKSVNTKSNSKHDSRTQHLPTSAPFELGARYLAAANLYSLTRHFPTQKLPMSAPLNREHEIEQSTRNRAANLYSQSQQLPTSAHLCGEHKSTFLHWLSKFQHQYVWIKSEQSTFIPCLSSCKRKHVCASLFPDSAVADVSTLV